MKIWVMSVFWIVTLFVGLVAGYAIARNASAVTVKAYQAGFDACQAQF